MIEKTKNPGLYPKNLGKQEHPVPVGLAVMLQYGSVRQVLVGFLQCLFGVNRQMD